MPKRKESKQKKVQILLADAKEMKAKKVPEINLKRAAKGVLAVDKVIVEDEEYEIILPLYSERQFGEKHGVKKLRLEFSLTESLYLMERDKLEVYSTQRSRKPLTVAGFARLANRKESNFWTRYRVYRELRTRGYIVKTALKFGADFRVYNRGTKMALFIVFIIVIIKTNFPILPLISHRNYLYYGFFIIIINMIF